MLVGLLVRSTPKSAAPERCLSLVGSGLTTIIELGWKGLPGKNALPYLGKLVNYGRKKFYNFLNLRKYSLKIANILAILILFLLSLWP